MLCAALAFGCSSSQGGPTGGVGDAGGSDGGDAGGTKLAFSSCPLFTELGKAPPSGPLEVGAAFDGMPSPIGQMLAISNAIDGMASATAECATMKVPAVWSVPEGDAIDVFVKRFPARVQPAKGQLWMLQGGPGFPGSVFETWAFLIAAALPTFDIYLPDHRGTGRSTLADCAQGVSLPECAASTPHLDGLTSMDAARDLASLIDASHTDAQRVFVYAFSYGTYWAQRYLQIRPGQADGVILDSTVPIGEDFSTVDESFDQKAREVLALCQADPTCSAKLGPDPLARAKEAVHAVDTGACKLPSGLRPVRLYFGDLVGAPYFERMLLPASVYRLLRCSDGDRAWLAKIGAYLGWWGSLFSSGHSDVVNINITLSELWHTQATLADIRAATSSMVAYHGGPSWFASYADSWPRYAPDADYGTWPSPSMPLLILQGTLDGNTAYGDVVKSHYSGKNQYYVEVPRAPHGPAWPMGSPMTDLTVPSCGWQVVQSFLADPTKAPDTACIAGMAPFDFGSPPAEWLALVGIQDLWENL